MCSNVLSPEPILDEQLYAAQTARHSASLPGSWVRDESIGPCPTSRLASQAPFQGVLVLRPQFVGDFSTPSDVYSSTRIGINYGPDHIKGTADDVRISSGPATQVVDELVYVGIGNALAGGDVSCPGSSQATLDCVKAFYDSIIPFSITTTYTLKDGGGSTLGTGAATVPFVNTSTPEPSTWGLMLAGLAGLAWKRLRR